MTSNYGRTPLHVAAGEGDLDTVRFLLKKGADIGYRDDFREPALNDAIRSKGAGGREAVATKPALTPEHSPHRTAQHSTAHAPQSPLERAQFGARRIVVKECLFMASGKHLNYADYDKRTPLHVLRDFHNNRPLEDARRLGFKYMEELLLADQVRRQAVAEEEERLRELQAEIEKDTEELFCLDFFYFNLIL
ncbi:UNVERIFIED_CONTAM: hypothetical protein FKN15_050226 [Acipenser sinensis]